MVLMPMLLATMQLRLYKMYGVCDAATPHIIVDLDSDRARESPECAACGAVRALRPCARDRAR